jgi:hypothetical protein
MAQRENGTFFIFKPKHLPENETHQAQVILWPKHLPENETHQAQVIL